MAIEYQYVNKRNPIDPTAPPKVYALAVHNKTFDLKKLARELAGRSTTASEGDVYSVLIGLRDLMKEHLDRSDRVMIDGIGSFEIAVSSDGAESEEKFHPSLIKGAKVLYKSDAEMKDFVKGLKFEKSSTK
jgi:predicted histone-like DNA-binding protein